MRPHAILFFFLTLNALGAAAGPGNPAEAPTLVPTRLLTVPEGFEVTVWARSPQLFNPTNIDVDAQGRVWVMEGVNYRKQAQPEGDRVVILEDTDGDGRADKSSVFVQEPVLNAPLGIAVIDNQVFISNAPDLIVYTDIDRDGKFDGRIDRREVLATGFNGRAHDHALHSVTFGPDSWLYFNQGNTGALFTDRSTRTFRVGSVYDPRPTGNLPTFYWQPIDLAGAKSDDGHVYVGGFAVRMKPDGTAAEIIGHNFRNSYEQTVTSFGDMFQNDNDDTIGCRTAFLMEYGSAGFFSRDGTRGWNADRRPGQSIPTSEWRQEDPGVMPSGDVYGAGSPTGIAFNEGDALGKKWRGLLLSCEAGRNVVFGYLPKPDGAGYALERFAFLTSNREERFAGINRHPASSTLATSFRPSDVAVGPDGAIYVADWFDPKIGGNGQLDPGSNGAIYRIVPIGFKSVIPRLNLETVEGQIEALKSPAVNVRALGYRRLRDQGKAAIAPVAALLEDENPFIRARAIWLLAELGPEGRARVESQLRATDPMLRITAFRALRRIQDRVLLHASELATDPSPAVRREVALALRDVPLSEARELLLILAKGYDGKDRSYLEAWGTGCTGKEAGIYAALAAGQSEKNPVRWPAAYARLVWRLTPVGATSAFAVRARADSLSEAERLESVTALGFIPTQAAAEALLDLAHQSSGKLKEHALWWLLNYKDSRWKEYNLDAALKQSGLYDPDRVTASASIIPPAPASQLPSVATIAGLKGDATRGATLATACFLCHRIGDKGVDYAPVLTGFASRQSIEAVISAIVDPSADISQGYDGTEVILKDGTVIDGLVYTVKNPLMIRTLGGVTQMIPSAKIASRKPLGRSLMLSAEQLNLSSQDVADIVAYLRTQ